MIIRCRAHPRAGLMGNPSDGYFGRTLSFCFSNFRAEVTLYETPELEILPSPRDESTFGSMDALWQDVRLYGYYGGIRLLKAAVKRFREYCHEHHLSLAPRNFTLRYDTDIPHHVGLAGSSAIITACLRALMEFFEVSIPSPQLANLILSVETQELGIAAGLQDRVVQVYEGVVYMDFAKELMDRQGVGRYERLDPSLLPPLYIAYTADLAEESGVSHGDLRGRYDRGEPDVLEAVRVWADYARQARECLVRRDVAELRRLIDANFDLRRRVLNISPGNLRLIETARAAGASAKFTGSGGAIVGVCEDDAMFRRLEEALGALRARVLRPAITPPREGA